MRDDQFKKEMKEVCNVYVDKEHNKLEFMGYIKIFEKELHSGYKVRFDNLFWLIHHLSLTVVELQKEIDELRGE